MVNLIHSASLGVIMGLCIALLIRTTEIRTEANAHTAQHNDLATHMSAINENLNGASVYIVPGETE